MTQKKYYPETSSSPDFAKLEKETLAFWQKEQIFEKSVSNRPARKDGKNNEFIFYDGPPFANGLPHYGHLLTGFVKDIFARYQTMQGKRTERRFGWDTHGLPVEMEVEKELGVSGQIAINEYGIDKFNSSCRTSVMKYAGEWKDYVSRQGRWVDFENGYKTMDKSYMESTIWAFKQLHEKGLLYEDLRVMPYSWACQTPLSNFETRMDNSYREKESKAVTVKFELEEVPKFLKGFDSYNPVLDSLIFTFKETYGGTGNEGGIKCFVLAWTTTPWTLPSNLALAIGEDFDYIAVKKESIIYILAKSAFLGKYSKELEGFEIIDEFKGKKLQGVVYKPLFPYFESYKVDDGCVGRRGGFDLNSRQVVGSKKVFTILHGGFVTTEDGTGIVHIAPGFGEDDQLLAKENGIPTICPVDEGGKFTSAIWDLVYKNKENKEVTLSLREKNVLGYNANLDHVKDVEPNAEIIKYLKAIDALVGNPEQYIHNYPHCWRTDTPLIYKAMPSWYVKVTDFKDRMVELNQQINWTPNHVKDGLFGKWLENARDWSISRNRFWGCPVPVWKSDDPQYPRLDVYGSIAEMEKDFGVEIKDLHRPFIDELTRPNPDDPSGKSMMRRVSDVLDCWFESGSMPYAQAHYPFENKDWFEGHFPADFIVEYQAQTRGWFYTLMVLSTALFDKPPFLNCICHGVILDENSQKLSKRLRNYADPHDIFASYGADAMRWFMAKSTVMRGNDLNIDKDGNAIRETLRLSLKPIWNSYNFFTLYANADNLQAEFDLTSDNLLDRYILSKTKHLVLEVKRSLDDYDTPNACSLSESFFEILNNWYIRRNRQRFWNSEKNQDKQSAYNTLYSVLHITMRAIAPLLPFISEEIFKALDQKAVSVHLEDFPDVSSIKEDAELVAKMDNVREVCNAALSIRAKENLRIRLPLAELKIIGSSLLNLADYADIIADELNVKKVSFIEDLGDLAELKLQLNFPILGKRLGARMKEIASACREGKWQKTAEGVQISDVTLQPEEYSLALVPKDQKSMLALSSNDALIALDLNITKELEQEGLARDIVRLIQQDRKAKDFDISDHIKVELGQVTKSVSESIGQFSDYIKKQVLADDIIIADNGDYEFTHELEGEKLLINLTKV